MSDLLEQYKVLHKKKKGYGRTGESLKTVIEPLVEGKRVLDYGCGKSDLVNMMQCKGYKYDPAIEEFNKLPDDKIDILITTDVLEHIPTDNTDKFIEKLLKISDKQIHAISLRESGNILPDGRPCHLTVKPKKWWVKKLSNYFKVKTVKDFKEVQKTVLKCGF